jgi:hypothetical protein
MTQTEEKQESKKLQEAPNDWDLYPHVLREYMDGAGTFERFAVS